MVKIPAEAVPVSLDRIVRDAFAVSWGKARAMIASGKVFVDGEACLVSERKIRGGSTIELRQNAPRPRKMAGKPGVAFERAHIVFVDTQVVVVRKPAGISTVLFEGEEGPALDELVRRTLSTKGRAPLGVVHRIDKETSGLLVFTRTWDAKQNLSNQFRNHTTERSYLAIAHGIIARKQTIESEFVENRGDGLRGSIKPGSNKGIHGKRAVTHVEPVEALDGATLVRVRLETGRTHQIRIHLSEASHPIVGERVYIRGFTGKEIPAPRLMLHAAELGFDHPNGKHLRFEDPPPEDFENVLSELRSTKRR